MAMIKIRRLGLIGAIAIGLILRFWDLELKPLWMDEVITAIFSLGKNYHDLPLDVVVNLQDIPKIFTFQPGVSCGEITQNLTNQSTHPPLFFCGMYRWLGWIGISSDDWVMKLRSLPALFGVGAIVAIYAVNYLAFSRISGIVAALFMAVSPFAVYLSQEARHYTLPMFLITLSLWGLMQIQQDISQERVRFKVWFFWTLVNIIGFYTHYFFILDFIAEIFTLSLLIYRSKYQNSSFIRKIILYFGLSIITIIICFLPWLLVTWNHAQRSETSWLNSPGIFAPFYQTLLNLVLMVIALPVENQPLIITIVCGLLMLVFAVWLGVKLFPRYQQLWKQDKTHGATFTLFMFTACVMLQCLAIAYLSGKDITAIPRYSFVYYPSCCALLAAGLSEIPPLKSQNFQQIAILLIVGVLSSIFVVTNFVFQKPFQPEQVARNMNSAPSLPVMLAVTYDSYQDIALGLSFALALEQIRNHTSHSDGFIAVSRSPDVSNVWKKLSQLPVNVTSPLNLWIVAPGLRRRDYPQQLNLSAQTSCQIDPQHHYRIGIPYQLYQCYFSEQS
ncbi:glycosyltransferase family 39 protein [Aliinostoc sp. HNIBRCY26]|uniref:glycosyltransferase family 39 protein n=1 Tax=Aliinostoc sp. HNIBRCY26 TaxID=3418997 RepID=UPI003D07B28A